MGRFWVTTSPVPCYRHASEATTVTDLNKCSDGSLDSSLDPLANDFWIAFGPALRPPPTRRVIVLKRQKDYDKSRGYPWKL